MCHLISCSCHWDVQTLKNKTKEGKSGTLENSLDLFNERIWDLSDLRSLLSCSFPLCLCGRCTNGAAKRAEVICFCCMVILITNNLAADVLNASFYSSLWLLYDALSLNTHLDERQHTVYIDSNPFFCANEHHPLSPVSSPHRSICWCRCLKWS